MIFTDWNGGQSESRVGLKEFHMRFGTKATGIQSYCQKARMADQAFRSRSEYLRYDVAIHVRWPGERGERVMLYFLIIDRRC